MVAKKKKAQFNIESLAGIVIISGGLLYMVGKGGFGAILVTVGLLIELIVKNIKW